MHYPNFPIYASAKKNLKEFNKRTDNLAMKEKSNPLVSVCMLAYNRPQGLENTINYIVAQSYQNLEILISDDCSPNPLVQQVAKHFAGQYPRIRFFRQEKNLGIIDNHGFLLNEVKGKYMMWACDDDWWHEDYIRVCVQALEGNDEAVMCTTNMSFVKDGNEYNRDFFEDIQTLGISDAYVRYRKVFQSIFWWNNGFYGVIRRNAISPGMLKKRFVFDYYFILELALKGSFIKLPPVYFKKYFGGIGKTLKSNHRAIGVKRGLLSNSPRINVFRYAIGDAFLYKELTWFQRIRLIQFLVRRIVNVDPMHGKQHSFREKLKKRLVSMIYFKETRLRNKLFPDSFVLEKLNNNHIPLNHVVYNKKNNELTLTKYGWNLKVPDQIEILNGYNYLRTLADVYNAETKTGKNGNFLLSSQNIEIIVKDSIDILMFHEIFALKVYNVIINQPAIVYDVGMNAGMAAMFFAANKYVEKVIAYEPFKNAYQKALENFDCNPALSQKIEAHNFGLGTENKSLELPSHEKVAERGRMKDIPKHKLQEHEIELKTEAVEIRNVVNILSKEMQKIKEQQIIFKMDCRGCGNEVMERLNESGLIRRFDVVILEWHRDNSKNMIRFLEKNNFKMFDLYNNPDKKIGMIYAINTA